MAVLGEYPVQVRVNRARRAMEVEVSGMSASQAILSQAEDCLKRVFGLSAATIALDGPAVSAPTEKAAEGDTVSPKQSTPVPETEPSLVLSQSAPESVKPAETSPAHGKREPAGLEAQMESMRRKLLRSNAPASGGGKKRVKQITGKITGKKKPVPLGELALDMGSVLVEGEVFNIEHRELPRRKAWVVCFDITDLTGSIRVTRFMEGEEAKPIIDQIKKGQRLQIQGRLTLGRFDNNDLVQIGRASCRERVLIQV